jgi:hypothetical protein
MNEGAKKYISYDDTVAITITEEAHSSIELKGDKFTH